MIVGCVACGDGDAGPALDVNIVRYSVGNVVVSSREPLPNCLPPQRWFPDVGECIYYSDDESCSGDPPSRCLLELSLERDGIVLEQRTSRLYGPEAFTIPDDDLTLSIRGCGRGTLIPLPRVEGAGPTVGEVLLRPSGLALELSDTGDGERLLVGGGGIFGGGVCNEPLSDEASPPTGYSLWVAGLRGGAAQETPVGAIHAWQVLAGIELQVVQPVPGVAGRWELPAGDLVATVSIDGLVQPGPSFLSAATADLLAPAPDETLVLVGYAGVGLEYAATATTDTVRLDLPDGRYIATLPHVIFTDGLQLGVPAAEHVSFALGPVTAVREDATVRTHEVVLTVDWNLGIIARPDGW